MRGGSGRAGFKSVTPHSINVQSHVVYDQGRMVTKAQSITAINVGTSKAQTNKLLRYGNDGVGLGNNGMQDDVEELGLQLSDDRKKRWVGLQESGAEDMCLEGYEFQVGPSFSTNKIGSPDRVPMLLAEPANQACHDQ